MFFKLKEHHLKRLLIATSLAVLTSLFSMHAQATTNQKKSTVQKSKPSVVKTHVRRQVVKAAPSIPSFGQKAGLHATNDILDLKSSVAFCRPGRPGAAVAMPFEFVLTWAGPAASDRPLARPRAERFKGAESGPCQSASSCSSSPA